jgi:toxin FitB
VRWLIDTNVVSETVTPRPNPRVVGWFEAQRAQDLAVSVVTIAELQHGVWLTRDEAKRAELARWVDTRIMILFADRILAAGTDALIRWLELQRLLSARRLSRSPADLLLAATAQTFDLTLATRNTRDFANTGITVYNPWTDETQQMEAP